MIGKPTSVPVTGGNGFAAPDLGPTDGSAFLDLVGADSTIQSRGLVDNTSGPFLAGSGGFTLDVGAGLNGKNAAKEHFNAGSTEQGADCIWHLPSSTKSLYASYFVRYSGLPGNSVCKAIRFRATDGTIIWTPGFDSGLGLTARFDQWGGLADDSNQHLSTGLTDHVEFHCDINDAHHCIGQMWLNGSALPILTQDYDYSASSPNPATFSFGQVDVNGVMNQPLSNSGNVWFWGFAFSTRRIGVPAGFLVPA